MRAMRTYVEDQFKRLDTVRKALSPPWSTHTVEAELGLRARDLRADLETERHTKATTPALAHLYDVAKER